MNERDAADEREQPADDPGDDVLESEDTDADAEDTGDDAAAETDAEIEADADAESGEETESADAVADGADEDGDAADERADDAGDEDGDAAADAEPAEGEAPAEDQAPADETPADEAPADEAPADEAPAEDEAVEDEPPADDEEPAAAGAGERSGRAQRRGAHARRVTPRERLREVIAPQANRTQALIALACLVIGFGLSVQVRSTAQESSFTSLRQSELVGLLDRLNKRQEDLRKEVSRLQQEKTALESEDSDAARRAAEDRQHTLAILAGTEPATGPGIELVISDPKGGVHASDVLNAVQELRDAGAEVIQIGSARVTVDTYFLDAEGGILVDDKMLKAPYRIKAIGDPHTMRTAMDIPGGVLETLHRAGADGTVTSSQSVAVTAVKEP